MDQRDHYVCHGTNDVIQGTDETTETIMKSNAGNSKIINDYVTVKWRMRSAECGVWSVENVECGERGVWKTRSVENAECGK